MTLILVISALIVFAFLISSFRSKTKGAKAFIWIPALLLVVPALVLIGRTGGVLGHTMGHLGRIPNGSGGGAVLVAMPLFYIVGAIIAVIIVLVLLAKTDGRLMQKFLAACFPALALLLVIGLFRHTQGRPLREAQSAVLESQATPAVWHEGITNAFVADVYPSSESAARALGRELGKRIQAAKIAVIPDNSSVESTLLQAFVAGLSDDDGYDLRTREVTLGPLQNQETTVVVLSVTPGSEAPASGRLMAQPRQPTAPWSPMTISYVEKPWLEDFSAYCNQHPGRKFAIAYSTASAATAVEADQQSLAAASTIVYRPSLATKEPLEAGLNKHGVLVDRFLQRLEGTAGPFWRQAMLLDVSPPKLAALRQDRRKAIQHEHRTWARILISGAILALAVFLVYLFLNAATRGYYTLALRSAAVTITVVVLALILFLRHPIL